MPFEMHSPNERWKTEQPLWAKLRDSARAMRANPTPAEARLWSALRLGLHGYRFRRQHSINRFIVDFYCSKAWLVVEVDGPIHEASIEEDRDRDVILRETGLSVLRFTNDRVLHNLDSVLREINTALETPPSPSPPGGEGDRGGEVASGSRLASISNEVVR